MDVRVSIRRSVEYILSLLGFGGEQASTDDDTATNTVSDQFESLTVYEVGDRVCRSNAYGVEIESVARQLYRDVDLQPDMITDLDRLLDDAEETSAQAKASGGIDPNKVETFREYFFDQFSNDEIERSIYRLYWIRHDEIFGLGALVEEQEVDGYRYTYQIADVDPSPVMPADEEMPIQESTFEEKTVEMMKVGAGIDLIESNVTETIDEMIETQASLLWDAIDIEPTDEGSYGGLVELAPVFGAITAIEEEYGRPDTIVLNCSDRDRRIAEDMREQSTFEDRTGVMDVPFVVADTDTLGYKLTSTPLTGEWSDKYEHPYRYKMWWEGNYTIARDEMISGPVTE